mgnify:CR=1 FL=1
MNVNIYYGGRGLIEDPTLYVLSKIEEVLDEFKDNQKKFYDFQFFIDNESNTEQFPIIGYKHRSIDSITWTKDRSGN